jgi:hypothetical protein
MIPGNFEKKDRSVVERVVMNNERKSIFMDIFQKKLIWNKSYFSILKESMMISKNFDWRGNLIQRDLKSRKYWIKLCIFASIEMRTSEKQWNRDLTAFSKNSLRRNIHNFQISCTFNSTLGKEKGFDHKGVFFKTGLNLHQQFQTIFCDFKSIEI